MTRARTPASLHPRSRALRHARRLIMAQTRSSKSSGEQFEGARKLPRMCRVHGYVNNISLMQLRRGRRTGNGQAASHVRSNLDPAPPGSVRRAGAKAASAVALRFRLRAGGRSEARYFASINATRLTHATRPPPPTRDRNAGETHARHTPTHAELARRAAYCRSA